MLVVKTIGKCKSIKPLAKGKLVGSTSCNNVVKTIIFWHNSSIDEFANLVR